MFGNRVPCRRTHPAFKVRHLTFVSLRHQKHCCIYFCIRIQVGNMFGNYEIQATRKSLHSFGSGKLRVRPGTRLPATISTCTSRSPIKRGTTNHHHQTRLTRHRQVMHFRAIQPHPRKVRKTACVLSDVHKNMC